MPKYDHNIIYLKSENARMSIREMSTLVKKSPQRLKYSLSVLENEGVLGNTYCVIDYSFFGQILFRVYFKGGYISEKDKANRIKFLSENPYIISIYELTGEFDLVVEFASPNPSRFNKEFKKLITETPALNDYKIVLNIVTHIYTRHYLTKSPALQAINPSDRIVGGDREPENFSENEFKVIKHINENAKMRLNELSEKTKLNNKTVKSILTSLTKRSIIKGFKQIVDINELGVNKSRLFLKIHNVTKERETQLMDFMKATKEVVQLNKTVGDWDMEIDIETLDKNATRQLIVKVREEFKDLIERFNLIEFYSYYKRAYLPEYLFKEEEKPKK